MGNFNNNRFDNGRSGDSRGFEKPQMHSAVCSKCGKSCMVPFKPTGNRPIFCNDCFKTEGANLPRRDERGPQMSANRSDRPMFDAICDKCGSRCQIPFQPRPGKQVFCSHCFEQKEKEGKGFQDRPQSNDQLASLNAKLDKIIELLSPTMAESKGKRAESKEQVAESKPELKEEVILTPIVALAAKESDVKVTEKKAPAKKKVAAKKKISSKKE